MLKQRAPPPLDAVPDKEVPGHVDSPSATPEGGARQSHWKAAVAAVEREVMTPMAVANTGLADHLWDAYQGQQIVQDASKDSMHKVAPEAQWAPMNTSTSSTAGSLAPCYSKKRTSCVRNDPDLWQAVEAGDVDEVDLCLKDQAHPDMVIEHDDSMALIYKGRAFRAQPIHMASCRGHAAVIHMLLDASASVNSSARTCVESGKARECQPIHMAAGSGSRDALLELLKHRADPNAEATLNHKLHYNPIHDAAFFDARWSIKALLEHKARIDAPNINGDTPLHLCAAYGNLDAAEFILQVNYRGRRIVSHGQDRQMVRLVTKRNKQQKTPLDLAVTQGQFPPRKLWLFTHCLKGLGDELIASFMNVAKACPAAVPLLLREGEDEADLSSVPISPKWIQTFKEGGRRGDIKVHDLAVLVYEAPQAYVDLIEALSHKPRTGNNEHHPLPIRVSLPSDSEACPMSCDYQEDDEWFWDNTQTAQRKWHERFAKADPKKGSEVTIKVVHLRGIADLELVYYLGIAPNLRVFTKLATHALLKYMWSQLCLIYIVDLIHEVATVLVLSYWATGEKLWSISENPSKTTRSVIWCIVASFGLTEATFLFWCFVRLPLFLHDRCQERDKSGGHTLHRACSTSLHFAYQWSHRIALAVLTLAVATMLEEDLGPKGNSSVILSVTNLLHWMFLLYRLRAFQWLGKRLLPVMKSVIPIVGMLIIMIFLLLGFLHAFWAMDRHSGDEILLFEVVVLLFSGEPAVSLLMEEELQRFDDLSRYYIIFLVFSALLIFGCCFVNVFIAVLGDIYDQEQDRVVCTYLQERAKICTLLLLRPNFAFLPSANMAVGRCRSAIWVTFFLFVMVMIAIIFGLLIHQFVKVGLWIWLSAMVLALGMVLIQGILRSVLTESWSRNVLWFCHEVRADEAEFLNASERSSQLHDGRLARIRKEVQNSGDKLNMTCTNVNERVKRILNIVTENGHPISEGDRDRAADAARSYDMGPPSVSGGEGLPRTSTWGTLPGSTPAGSGPEAMIFDRQVTAETPTHGMRPPPPPTQTGDLTFPDHGISFSNLDRGLPIGGVAPITALDTAHYNGHGPGGPSDAAFGARGMQHAALTGEQWPNVEAVAVQLNHQLSSMRQALEKLESRLDKQDENYERLESTCLRTEDKLQVILDKAARRRENKRGAGGGDTQYRALEAVTEHTSQPVSPNFGDAQHRDAADVPADAAADVEHKAAEAAPEHATRASSSNAPRQHDQSLKSPSQEGPGVLGHDNHERADSKSSLTPSPPEPEQVFSIGDTCESKDRFGRWWPVRITTRHPDGTYAVDVLDGFGNKWDMVLSHHLRPFVWAFAEGAECEAQNKREEWWRVTIIGRNTDTCTYAVEVHDDRRSQWPVVYPWNMRQLPQASEQEEGSVTNQSRGALLT